MFGLLGGNPILNGWHDEAMGVLVGLMQQLGQAAADAARAIEYGCGKAYETARDIANSPEVRNAVEKAVPVAKAAAADVGRAVSAVAEKAVPVIRRAASSAVDAACKAGSSAVDAASNAVAGCATSVRDADARPHAVTDPVTGQEVFVEAYVVRPDGTRDYDAVYPGNVKRDFGPVGNRLVGALLILAGIPMLILPGPGIAAIGAGLYFWCRGDGGRKA